MTSPRASTAPLTRILPLVRYDEGCWTYSGYCTPAGYGQVNANGFRNAFAHRVVWQELVGPVPPGMHFDHLCRNRACCKPAHLEVVTRAENLRRGNGVSGLNSRVQICPRGHDYDETNTYFRPDGKGRDCRTCRSNYRQGLSPIVAKDVRLAIGWTQQQVADEVGIPRHAVQRSESDGCSVTQQYLETLCFLVEEAGFLIDSDVAVPA
jgi:DNA-binding XRE family transcriptional regulator